MGFDIAIAELTAALKENIAVMKENTAAHTRLTAVAVAAQKDKPAPSDANLKPKSAPKVDGAVDAEAIRAAAREHLSGGDEEERAAKNLNLGSASEHLGIGMIAELENVQDRAKAAAGIAYWTAGLQVLFEDLEEKVLSQLEATSGVSEEEDDLIG
jgi:hypothetical protein